MGKRVGYCPYCKCDQPMKRVPHITGMVYRVYMIQCKNCDHIIDAEFWSKGEKDEKSGQ